MTHDIEELEALPWDTIMIDLRYHAERRMLRFVWQGRRGKESMPEGYRAEDIVQDAVLKFLDGSRQWNRQRYPNLCDFLRGIVDSEIIHRAQSWANRNLRTLATLSTGDQQRVSSTPQDGTVEEQVLWQQADEEAARIIVGFDESLTDEPLLRQVLAATMEGVERRRDMIRLLGITAAELDNARKRLQRRWTQFCAPPRARTRRERS